MQPFCFEIASLIIKFSHWGNLMEKDDVQLIDSILSGDETAFTTLVKKHQKSVHALVWGKIGDFQIAEEITQDTFLQVHKKLYTLKKPSQFAGWLYVIADRLCTAWLRKQKPKMQSLDASNVVMTLERYTYEQYLLEQREEAATEYRRELVRRLLEKLPESERTVMILHYFGEMTCEAISRFLGVSVNTIKSRLSRARKRLKTEDPMIRETFGSVQLPPNFTDNILQQVANTEPVTAPVGKPLLPWAALSSTVALLILMLGASDRYFASFQKPYSLEAQSEIAVEIVDVPFILDIEAETDVRKQIIGVATAGQSNGSSPQTPDAGLSSEEEKDSSTVSDTAHQWTQVSGPQGGKVHEIFHTSERKLYAVSPTGIYQLKADKTQWTLINNTVPTGGSWMPMAEANGILYIVSTDEVFASADDGVTWDALGPRPRGQAIGLVITDETFYLAIKNGIFHSTDVGKQWSPLNNGLNDRTISAITSIGNTVFAGTDQGLYRLSTSTWERLSDIPSNEITSLATFENNLYIGINPEKSIDGSSELTKGNISQILEQWKNNGWIFRSSDFGNTWIDITPQIDLHIPPMGGIQLLVTPKTLLALSNFEIITGFRSQNGGITWTELSKAADIFFPFYPSVAVNKNTTYRVGLDGIQRSTNGGKSWHLFMKGMVGTSLRNLVAINNTLYAKYGREVVKSSDGGKSWTPLHVADSDELAFRLRFAIEKNALYVISQQTSNIQILRLSSNGNELVPIKGAPSFEGVGLRRGLSAELLKEAEKDIPNAKKISALGEKLLRLSKGADTSSRNVPKAVTRFGEFAVSGDIFYLEYDRELVKWNPGNSLWTHTGFIDMGEQPRYTSNGFRLAVLDETVYVGKRDGHLFQSLDSGNTWKDVTPNLSISFNLFKEIVFAGSTVYVGTDNGVLTSDDGEKWRVLTDNNGDRIAMDSLASAGTKVYGACNAGVYQLDNKGIWELRWPEVPDRVCDLVVSNDVLYITTNRLGMFHIPLKKSNE